MPDEIDPVLAASIAAITGNAFISLAMVGTLAKGGLVTCADVATNAEFFATLMGQIDAPPAVQKSAADQLQQFARLVRSSGTMPAGAGRA